MLVFILLALYLQNVWSVPAVDNCSPDDHRLLILGQAILRFNVTELLPREMTEVIRWIDSFGADVVFSNLETAIEGTYAREHKGTVNNKVPHVADPSTLDVLKSFLINMWSTANNHAYDLGPSGVVSTAEELDKRSMPYTGFGQNISEAVKPLVLPKRGLSWGLHAVVSAPGLIRYGGVATRSDAGANAMILNTTTQLFDNAQQQLQLETVSQLCETADIALSYHHTHGVPPTNGYIVPDWWKNYAHDVIDHGASIYIGQGPTNLYPIEVYNGQLILYGTGSFFFQTEKPAGSYPNITSWQGVITDVCFAKGTTELKQVRLIPISLSNSGTGTPNSEEWFQTLGVPSKCNATMANEILASLRDASAPFGTKISVDGENGVGYVEIPSRESQTSLPRSCRRYKNLVKETGGRHRAQWHASGVFLVLTLWSLKF